MISALSLLLESASFSVYGWLVAALICLIFEVLNPGLFFFISFSAGSVFAAGMAWNDFSIAIQCITFLAVSLLTFFITRWYFKNQPTKLDSKTGVEALVGKEAVVIEAVSHLHSGRVKIRFETWPAITQGKVRFEKGEVVHVVGIKGNHVIISH